jgi:hypothetical protein
MMSGDWAEAGHGRPGPSVEDEGPVEAALDRAVQARIGEQLRAMYDGLMEQPVPERFHALLARLETGGT